jgi:hypothetical protein
MKTIAIAALALAGFGNTVKEDLAASAIEKGSAWLVSVQGSDGGWGQDGGATSYLRRGERLESTGNDVANTAVAALALVKTRHAGNAGVKKAVEFVLRSVEASPTQGLQVTDVTGTQIQRKLGPFIDTFLTAQLLAEVDGRMDAATNARVRSALNKCVKKIESNQEKDGSWNTSGAWAPIFSTSMASRGLAAAKARGVAVNESALLRVENYTRNSSPQGPQGGAAGGRAADAAAGVDLYKRAQELEQYSRNEKGRRENNAEIRRVVGQFRDDRFVAGFGSMGGEEFFSYLNISDSLHRIGGDEWRQWNGDIKTRLVKLQNQDGSWAGHHCVTGRVAVTSAAMLTMLVERTVPGK